MARLIQMLEDGSTQGDVAAAFGVTQSMVSRAWRLEPVAASDAYMYDAQPLAKTATSTKWLYIAVTVLPEHSRWTSCKPQDSESVTKVFAIDSMSMAFTAYDQPVFPLSPGNPIKLNLALLTIIKIGSCVTGIPFSSQTSPDSMSLLVTDV